MNCIIVPIYKDFSKLSTGEYTSLFHLFKILGKHQIFFIGPTSMDWLPYLTEAKCYNLSPKVKEFENRYFNSIEGYNILMTSMDFLNAFSRHNYILVYQLDSLVFRDELDYWCSQGYDYIGAPWFEKDNEGNWFLG